MLLTLTYRAATASTDLGYLLHKHPERAHTFALSFGRAHVFYPEAGPDACACALLLEVDPFELVRHARLHAGEGRSIAHYVNDRPYVTSSLFSVAIGNAFGSALAGRSRERPELATRRLPLTARLAAVPCHGGEALLRRLFAPLGYAVEAEAHPLDPMHPDWGLSRYVTVTLRGEQRLADLLAHLYVLLPVLDDDKHYWVGQDEVDKLLRRGEGWLASHPERDLVTRRYLRHRRSLADDALVRLMPEEVVAEAEADTDADTDADAAPPQVTATAGEAPQPLSALRQDAVLAALRGADARRVLDLGCGEGRLLKALLAAPEFTEIVGVDVSHRALERAAARLRLDQLPERQQQRIRLLHGSLVYRDARLEGFDAAALVEVIEHLDPERLEALERAILGCARPTTVIVTTPNAEYNALYAGLEAGEMRHDDHRFEWSRAEFGAWAEATAARHGYRVRLLPVGAVQAAVGAPTQMAVFTR